MKKCAGITLLLILLESSTCWAKTHQVVIKDMEYIPAHITISVGDTVEWINQDDFNHTVTTPDKTLELDIPAHQKQHVTFQKKGKSDYFCRYHPNMTGNVIVNKAIQSGK